MLILNFDLKLGANIHGVKISTLKSVLNPTFKWRKAIRSKLASTSPYYSNRFMDVSNLLAIQLSLLLYQYLFILSI